MKRTKTILIISLLLITTLTTAIADTCSKSDVNNDGLVDFQDSLSVWYNIGSENTTYDVNEDLVVDFQDALLVWNHIGCESSEEPQTFIEWITNIIWG